MYILFSFLKLLCNIEEKIAYDDVYLWVAARLYSRDPESIKATCNPNGSELPDWKPFDPAAKQVMVFGDEVKLQQVPYREQLEFLERSAMKPLT